MKTISLIKRSGLTALFLTLTACGGADSPDNPALQGNSVDAQSLISQRPDRVPLVVGGSDVEGARYPWMTALVSADDPDPASGQFCGGSLIAPNWVLTAAHCVEDVRASQTDVLLGQLDLNDRTGERISVQRVIVHPDYASNEYPDIALLELSSSSSATPISLPSRNNPAPKDGEMATVIGWGQISETGPYSDVLNEAMVPIVDHNTCNRAYNFGIDQDNMVCAGSASGAEDSCYGDSGGPLFVSRNSEFVQAGIVSFGEECGLPGVPGVYTRVSSLFDWISAYAPVTAYDANATVQNIVGNNSNPSVTANTEDSQNNASSDSAWQFNGSVDGWYEEVYLPESEEAIAMAAGTLTVELQTDVRVIVFFEEYDEEYDEWYTVTAAVSRNGYVALDADIENGLYGFSVVSLGRSSSFTLNATLN